MRPKDRESAARLEHLLQDFDRNRVPLPGIADPATRAVLLEQIVESIHRVQFVRVLSTRNISARRADPKDELFDPLKAAILHQRTGNVEEAFWLIFFFVHFGKNPRGGWRYAREVYGRLGDVKRWDWPNASADPGGFRDWLHANRATLERKKPPGGFGNHRKYETLDAYSKNGTGAAVESYIGWVNPPRTHKDLVTDAVRNAGGDPFKAFGHLYDSMEAIARFGRTARFDYLAMLGKLGLAPIAPDSAYLGASTGPLRGAKLLFGAGAGAVRLEGYIAQLDGALRLGKQVLEDALCNWQKSPGAFRRFRG